MTRKNRITAALLSIMVLSLGIFAVSATNTGNKALATAPDITKPEQKLVTVQGEGVINVAPNIVFVTLGVDTTNKKVLPAQTENKEKMKAIMDELKRLGVAEKNIQTQEYNIFPEYNWEKERRTLIGYRVINRVRVKITKIDDTGRILDAVTAKGANTIDSIRFAVSDDNKAYQEALRIALKNAEEKAKAMVEQFGYTKVTPVTIIEGSQASIVRDFAQRMAATEAANVTPVSTGEMEIRAQVNVSFEFSK